MTNMCIILKVVKRSFPRVVSASGRFKEKIPQCNIYRDVVIIIIINHFSF